MNEQNKRTVIVAGVLGVVLVGVLIYQFGLNAGPSDITLPDGLTVAKSSGKEAGSSVAPTKLRRDEIDIDLLLQDIQVVDFNYELERIERNPMTPIVGGPLNGGDPGIGGGNPHSIAIVLQKRVTGIIWDKYNPLAVIDDEVISLGHAYPAGIEVYSIEANRVLFKVGDTLIPLEIKEL